jgi:hypothetical protein
LKELREKSPFQIDFEKDKQSRRDNMETQQQQKTRQQQQQKPDVQQRPQTFASAVSNYDFPEMAAVANPQNPTALALPQRQVSQSMHIERATKTISKFKLDVHDVLKHIQSMNSIDLKLTRQYPELEIESKILVIHSICSAKEMSLIETILTKMTQGMISFQDFDQFKQKFLELRFPSLSSHIESLWANLKMDDQHSTITSYLNTFKVSCNIAGKNTESVECKRKFINSLKSTEARRDLGREILEDNSLDYICERAEAIHVYEELKSKNANVHMATKQNISDHSDEEEEDELSLAYVNSKQNYDSKNKNYQKKFGIDLDKKLLNEQTPMQFIKKYNIDFDTCIQCLKKGGRHRATKCFLKKCLFCKSGTHKTFKCYKQPKNREELENFLKKRLQSLNFKTKQGAQYSAKMVEVESDIFDDYSQLIEAIELTESEEED